MTVPTASRVRRGTIFLLTLLAPWIGTQASAAAGSDGTAAHISSKGIAGWTQVGRHDENTLLAGEGVTTVTQASTTYELYRGIQSIPSNLKAQGWSHIGDPDSVRGYIVDAYQGPSSGKSKMFLVTTPSGQRLEYVHALVPREMYNNSFVAITPDSRWMTAGEWGTMSHLLIFPTPLLNHGTAQGGGSLPLTGYLTLDHKINDIQGCDFVTSTRLICASDDDSKTLFSNEKPLLAIELSTSIHGSTVRGHVVDLGSIPQESSCSGTFEAEGVDFDASTHILRVEIIQPGACILKTTIFEYKQAVGR